MRYGITVTKKIGGAVVRNRMKRRFRALVAELFPQNGISGADHVLIGRAGGVERDFGLLRIELEKALRRTIQNLANPDHVEKPRPAFNRSQKGARASKPAARTGEGR